MVHMHGCRRQQQTRVARADQRPRGSVNSGREHLEPVQIDRITSVYRCRRLALGLKPCSQPCTRSRPRNEVNVGCLLVSSTRRKRQTRPWSSVSAICRAGEPDTPPHIVAPRVTTEFTTRLRPSRHFYDTSYDTSYDELRRSRRKTGVVSRRFVVDSSYDCRRIQRRYDIFSDFATQPPRVDYPGVALTQA